MKKVVMVAWIAQLDILMVILSRNNVQIAQQVNIKTRKRDRNAKVKYKIYFVQLVTPIKSVGILIYHYSFYFSRLLH